MIDFFDEPSSNSWGRGGGRRRKVKRSAALRNRKNFSSVSKKMQERLLGALLTALRTEKVDVYEATDFDLHSDDHNEKLVCSMHIPVPEETTTIIRLFADKTFIVERGGRYKGKFTVRKSFFLFQNARTRLYEEIVHELRAENCSLYISEKEGRDIDKIIESIEDVAFPLSLKEKIDALEK